MEKVEANATENGDGGSPIEKENVHTEEEIGSNSERNNNDNVEAVASSNAVVEEAQVEVELQVDPTAVATTSSLVSSDGVKFDSTVKEKSIDSNGDSSSNNNFNNSNDNGKDENSNNGNNESNDNNSGNSGGVDSGSPSPKATIADTSPPPLSLLENQIFSQVSAPKAEPKEATPSEGVSKMSMTIRNLDTGEEFVIGENDPDFEFNTFELTDNTEDAQAPATPASKTSGSNPPQVQRQESVTEKSKESWWNKLMSYIYSGSSKSDGSSAGGDEGSLPTSAQKIKTPFTKLSSFKFRKELGRGAFGRVLLAEAKVDGKLYALKIIGKKNMRTSDRKQAKAERDILHAMGHAAPHPFTTGLKFAFQSENNLYLGMDYLPGGNLKEMIRRYGSLPEDWVKFYSAELVLAISHLHSLRVIYRDIKPHNVMIDSQGHLILIDFGLSKQDIESPQSAMTLVGTPDYSAPEVLKTGVYLIEQSNKNKKDGKADEKSIQAQKDKKGGVKKDEKDEIPSHIGYGKAADWWSLGVMIFEMLSGTPAFRGNDLRQTYQKVLYAEVDFKPADKFSASARGLLSGLLKKEPSVRYGNAENPPKDIMDSPFFSGIEWDAIYERRSLGPWYPDMNTKKAPGNPSKLSAFAPKEVKEEVEKDEFAAFNDSPNDGNDANGNSDVNPSKEKALEKNINLAFSVVKPTKEHVPAVVNGEIDGGASEILNLRDSIVVSSKNTQANRIQDWSFFDEKILASANEKGTNASGTPNDKRGSMFNWKP